MVLNGDITDRRLRCAVVEESIPYRAILGARNARIALEHGFTAFAIWKRRRHVRRRRREEHAIANGEVPGPRMQVATRAMAPTGMYPLLGYSWEIEVPTGVQYVDGVEGAQSGTRASDVSAPTGSNIIPIENIIMNRTACCTAVNFTDEAKAIVDESRRLGNELRPTRSVLMELPRLSAPVSIASSTVTGSPKR